MKLLEMPVMARISPATADRFALFVEALRAEAADLPREAQAPGTVALRTPEGAAGSDLELEIRSDCL